MSDKPENPSAFPFPDVRDQDGCGIREGSDGMTLRDYFAGQAIIRLIDMSMTDAGGYSLPIAEREPARARAAYRIADAMLAERAKS